MKEIPNTFERGGFTYNLVKRDGEATLFTKTFTNKPDGPKWFEVVKLILDGNGDETFPAPSSCGILFHTFPAMKADEAEAKYADFVNEFGATPHESPTVIVHPDPPPAPPHHHVGDDNSKRDEPTLARILPVNPPPMPTAADVVQKATRGRKKLDVALTIPDTGTFQARELADETGMSVPFVHNRLKNLVAEGKIRIKERVQGRRGKPVLLFEKVK